MTPRQREILEAMRHEPMTAVELSKTTIIGRSWMIATSASWPRRAVTGSTSTSCQMLGAKKSDRTRTGTTHSCGGRLSSLWRWGRYDESIFKRVYAMIYILIMVILILADL